MKTTFLIFYSFFFSTTLALAQSKNYLDRAYIEVQGYADTAVTPDEIFIQIYVSERDTKDKQSLESLELKMIDTLKKMHIDTEKDLTIADLNSNFKSYLFKGKDILKSKKYILKVSKAAVATDVFIALENMGISNTEIDHVSYSKLDELKLYLRSRASLDAKAKAIAYAQPLHQSIGQALYISETARNSDKLLYSDNRSEEFAVKGLRYSSGSVERGSSAPAIDFKKIDVSISIEVAFELK